MLKFVDRLLDELRLRSSKGEKRKDTDFASDAAKLSHRLAMELLAELRRVEKQEMRADRKVEGFIGKRKRWQFRVNVAAVPPSCVVVCEELDHRRHANPAKFVDRSNLVPDEFLLILSSLLEHGRPRFVDALPDLAPTKAVQRIARHHLRPAAGSFGIEACWAIAATEDAEAQIIVAQQEHPAVLVV
jgi:hypothetical protein